MNVYFDSSHSALKYLKDTEVNIHNLLVITGNFNIWDNLWDLSFPYHSLISDDLIIIADSFNLNLLCPINQVLTRYSNNSNDLNSVIDLIFLWCDSTELDNHLIHSDWCLISDHMPLSVTIPITEENINSQKRTIIKDSKEEESFVKEVIASFKNIDTFNLLNIPHLEKL